MRRRVTKNTVRASKTTGKRDKRDKIGREFPAEEKMPKLKGNSMFSLASHTKYASKKQNAQSNFDERKKNSWEII